MGAAKVLSPLRDTPDSLGLALLKLAPLHPILQPLNIDFLALHEAAQLDRVLRQVEFGFVGLERKENEYDFF